MNAETFCEQFETFAEAPNGVAKLRELILQLAVQGKLGTQDPNDEPAEVLFGQIHQRRRELVAEGRLPSNPKPVPIADGEVETIIPAHWRWARLNEIVSVMDSGWSPACDEDPTTDESEWGVLKTTSVQTMFFNQAAHKRLPSNLTPRPEAEAKAGDLLITRAGPQNRVGISCLVKSVRPRLMISDKIIRFHLIEPFLFEEFIALCLNAGASQAHIERAKSGMAASQMNISQVKFRMTPIPIPPLAEQRRIVGKVDQLLGLCDELAARQAARREARERLVGATLDRLVSARSAAEFPAHAHRLRDHFDRLFDTPTTLPQLRQAILQLAVQGQLVPQDPNDEPASVRGEMENQQTNEPLFDMPGGWVWTRLSNLADINGGFAFKSTDYTDEGMRVIRISDFDEFGFKDHKVVRHFFTPELARFSLAQANILMAMTGGTVGKSYLVRSLPEPMIVNQRVATIKVSDRANPSYIDLVIRSEMTQEVIRNAKNSTNDNISMGDIKGFAIPLPPLSEQKRIVSKVTELLSLCDALEAKLTQADSASTQLLSAAVHHLLQEDSREGAKPRRETAG